ncbi:nucleoside/nucleotide kinase family protein [Cupriavidus metallidurans]|uniref:hypothetical protein n=1 Tax=Cupriavidus metallidurans TaxID=119219 RepID=UPI000055035E|nr:hypothetical protein [Cupriavidus metallidurans]QGS28989.1 hypothetical protein FOB83_08810 [Cupriavidus metallidurans]
MVTWSHSVSIPIKTEFEVGAASNEEATGSKNLPRLKDRITEELVIGLVGPVGSGCTTTGAQIATILERDYGYKVYRHKLSDLIVSHAHLTGEKFDDNHRGADRISQLQRIGDNLRRLCGHGYLAAKAIERIAQLRMEFGFGKSLDGLDVPLSVRTVHIIDSLKNPNELRLLRDTYGGMFWLFGVFAPESVRKDRLEHHQRLDPESLQAIIKRDYSEAEKHGQSVRDVFHQADFFVRNDQSNEGMLTLVLNRYLEILFGYPVHTPNSDESAMAAAHAEASKSACLSRQVGAAIASPLAGC